MKSVVAKSVCSLCLGLSLYWTNMLGRWDCTTVEKSGIIYVRLFFYFHFFKLHQLQFHNFAILLYLTILSIGDWKQYLWREHLLDFMQAYRFTWQLRVFCYQWLLPLHDFCTFCFVLSLSELGIPWRLLFIPLKHSFESFFHLAKLDLDMYIPNLGHAISFPFLPLLVWLSSMHLELCGIVIWLCWNQWTVNER